MPETKQAKTQIGFHASHEQFAPSKLLDLVQKAEAAGFTAAMCSDHFHPWTGQQGQSGLAWAWLGAALQATSLPFGEVCAPGQRYHPAIVAQAAATLSEMFPGRFWLAIGSGQLLNEGITGEQWPTKAHRNARLRESADIMRCLWDGETVTHRGHVQVSEAKLYTLPATPPRLISAAITPETAHWLGGWADGLITIARPREELQEVVDAFREGGGDRKPMYLQSQVSYAPTEEEALQGAWENWRSNIFDSSVLADLRTPEAFEAAGEFVKPEDVRGHVRVSADLGRHVGWIEGDLELGFDHVYLHNVNRDQERFIDDFGSRVLTRFNG